MSGKSFAAVRKAFVGEAESAFAFLVSDFGFAGPEVGGVVLPVVTFVGAEVSYRIMLDPDDQAVVTHVEVRLDETRLVAELANVVAVAKLDARNRVPGSAHTLHNLRQTLKAQSEHVRQLHPRLTFGAAADLMRRAGARERKARR